MIKKDVFVVGIGLGGSRVGCDFQQKNYDSYLINGSLQDNKTLPDAKNMLVLEGYDGLAGDRSLAFEALKNVGMPEELYDQSPFDLSGGQKRRVAIAGVLAMKPEVLILDEPTAGLDPKGRDEIFEQIVRMHEEEHMTIILVSHSMEDVAKYVDRMIVMNQGQILYDQTPANVFAHYKELESIGLAAPQVTYLMHELREAGFAVHTDASTVADAKKEILRILR